MYHERYLAHIVDGNIWMVVTPDEDMFAACLDAVRNRDVADVKFKATPDAVPLGMPAAAQV